MFPMPSTPRPAGWKGGSEDFGFVRTFDGHISSPAPASGDSSLIDELADSSDYGRNERMGFSEADLSGDDYDARH